MISPKDLTKIFFFSIHKEITLKYKEGKNSRKAPNALVPRQLQNLQILDL